MQALPTDLSIAPGQVHEPAQLPALDGADDVALLRNHVEVAKAYHALADRYRALVCGVLSQQGITVNGAAPAPPAWCAPPGASRPTP